MKFSVSMYKWKFIKVFVEYPNKNKLRCTVSTIFWANTSIHVNENDITLQRPQSRPKESCQVCVLHQPGFFGAMSKSQRKWCQCFVEIKLTSVLPCAGWVQKSIRRDILNLLNQIQFTYLNYANNDNNIFIQS